MHGATEMTKSCKEALRDLIALMDRDARANDANYAKILLLEPEVMDARKALEAEDATTH